MSRDFDAYHTLQVEPTAEDVVLEAAFRALARRYHPDGEAPDQQRMAEINRAWDLLRTPVRRRKFDREHHVRPVGPGLGSVATRTEAQPPPPEGNGTSSGGLGARAAARDRESSGGKAVLDFGRYEGWTLKDLAKHDPDYLRWLARSSGGVRYRNLISQLLTDATEAARSKF